MFILQSLHEITCSLLSKREIFSFNYTFVQEFKIKEVRLYAYTLNIVTIIFFYLLHVPFCRC